MTMTLWVERSEERRHRASRKNAFLAGTTALSARMGDLREAGGERATAPGQRSGDIQPTMGGARHDYGINSNNGGQHEQHRPGDGLGPFHRFR